MFFQLFNRWWRPVSLFFPLVVFGNQYVPDREPAYGTEFRKKRFRSTENNENEFPCWSERSSVPRIQELSDFAPGELTHAPSQRRIGAVNSFQFHHESALAFHLQLHFDCSRVSADNIGNTGRLVELHAERVNSSRLPVAALRMAWFADLLALQELVNSASTWCWPQSFCSLVGGWQFSQF